MISQIKNITPNNNTKISHQLQFYNILTTIKILSLEKLLDIKDISYHMI